MSARQDDGTHRELLQPDHQANSSNVRLFAAVDTVLDDEMIKDIEGTDKQPASGTIIASSILDEFEGEDDQLENDRSQFLHRIGQTLEQSVEIDQSNAAARAASGDMQMAQVTNGLNTENALLTLTGVMSSLPRKKGVNKDRSAKGIREKFG